MNGLADMCTWSIALGNMMLRHCCCGSLLASLKRGSSRLLCVSSKSNDTDTSHTVFLTRLLVLHEVPAHHCWVLTTLCLILLLLLLCRSTTGSPIRIVLWPYAFAFQRYDRGELVEAAILGA